MITITSFQWGRLPVREHLARFVADYPLHAQHRRIPFDLRGSGGGNLEPIREWLGLARSDGWKSWSMTEIMGKIAVSKPWSKTVEWQIPQGRTDSDQALEAGAPHFQQVSQQRQIFHEGTSGKRVGSVPVPCQDGLAQLRAIGIKAVSAAVRGLNRKIHAAHHLDPLIPMGRRYPA